MACSFITEFKSKQELLNEMRNFYKKEVAPMLPEYNDKRKKDRIYIIYYFFVFTGMLLTVFSTDQIEARSLLTTSFMERFKNIENAFNPIFQRAEFKDNELCILIGTKRDLFKMGSLNEETSYAHFYKLFKEFYSVIDMIEQLKLDQNIGL